MLNKWTARNKGKLEKKSIRLFEGDAAFIDELFPSAGHNVVIRRLVHNFRKRIENNVNAKELHDEFAELTRGDIPNSESVDGGPAGEPE